MELVISPYLLYVLIVLGGIGVWLALPRPRPMPQILGVAVVALAAGLVLVVLGIAAVRRGEGPPSVYFYVFAAIGLGASLRVITHPRPVYAALYFILSILASCGLYLILSAEFMAFALVIIYAGAILITYLFVIMLATQAPAQAGVEALTEYDRASREPLVATLAGFVLLAGLTTMLLSGTPGLPRPGAVAAPDAVLADLPKRVERAVERTWRGADGARVRSIDTSTIDVNARTVSVTTETGEVLTVPWPADLRATNVEGVGFNLLRDHPGSIELAGIILLMAMLGAVVLARKQVQIEEEAKAAQVRMLGAAGGAGGGTGGGEGGGA